ncbi:MAG: hypothetical protein GF311_23715 [Candidatus Lokiarchaeota archaeon]|nr:hypothetical protein [Candidatus Lokiarchaeota archaeon]
MAVNYYNKRRRRIIDSLKLNSYDPQPIISELEKLYRNGEIYKQLIIRLIFKSISENTDYINNAYQDDAIKSHELYEVIHDINNALYSHLSSYTERLNKTIKDNKVCDGALTVNFSSHHLTYTRLLWVEFILSDIQLIPLKILKGFLKPCLSDGATFSEKIHISFHTSGNKFLSHLKLSRKSIDQMRFLVLDNKTDLLEYYTHPKIQELLTTWFYPLAPNRNQNNKFTITKITLDKLQENLPVKKSLRIKNKRNEYVKIAKYLEKNPNSRDSLPKIINDNDIAGFYAGTTDLKGELRYLVIDIDVSSFMQSVIEPQVLYELLLSIASALTTTTQEFGIKGYPIVKFSGSRGLHIIYRYDENVLEDTTRRLNLKNYFYHLPGLYDLIKVSGSPFKSKTSFSRLLADALIVYTLYFQNLDLSRKINNLLGNKKHQKNLFTLSSYDENEIAILLDTSPNSRGVFRTAFSIHPTTKLVSLPITDIHDGKLLENYQDYEVLLDETTRVNILDHLQHKDKLSTTYDQISKSALISKDHIETLLRPDKILPAIAIILRFTRRFALQRSVSSFFYWYNYYEIKFTFEYLIHKTLIIEKKKEQGAVPLEEISEIISNSIISNKTAILDYIQNYVNNTISYHRLKDHLTALYHFEYYYKFSPVKISLRPLESVSKILQDPVERRDFFHKLQNIFTIILEIISHCLTQQSINSRHKIKALSQLGLKLQKLARIQNQIKNNNMLKKTDAEQYAKTKILYQIFLLIVFYNILTTFLRHYFKFDKINIKRRGI